MSRAALLARGRTAAEAGMVDTCTIRRVTGTAYDDFSGAPVKTYLSPDPYAGKCRVQQTRGESTQEDAGEDFFRLLRLELQVPTSVVGLQLNDEVTLTAVGPGRDQDLVGRVFLIRDLMHKTDATACRPQIVERTD
jgi:hypothetical protein